MLSRLSTNGGQCLKICALKFQPAAAVTTSAVAKSNTTTPSKYPPEFPPATSKRDHVNFPRLTIKDEAPPVRLGFIPESWFLSLYPKTGYTGPYMLLASLGTYILSKEIFVYDHNALHFYAFVATCWFVHTQYGDKIQKFYADGINEQAKAMDEEQELEKVQLREKINYLDSKKDLKDAAVEMGKAKTEIVQMQMEMSYRERMIQAYKSVKGALDCQVELENADRRAAQMNVADYVIRNVMKSITPDLEKSVLQSCISDLNALAARA